MLLNANCGMWAIVLCTAYTYYTDHGHMMRYADAIANANAIAK